MIELRRARIDEADALTGLCLRSKAVWGYDAGFLEACLVELKLTPQIIAASLIMVAERDGTVLGVAQVAVSGTESELTRLFVEPSAIGTGIGRALFDWVRTAARDSGCQRLVIESDPGAAEFYRRMGARDAGDVASGSLPGRRIPRLILTLD